MNLSSPHKDRLQKLGRRGTLGEKLKRIHEAMRPAYPAVDRIAVTLYDPETRRLQTFLHSGADDPLPHYEAPLEEAPSLQAILDAGLPRLIPDLRARAKAVPHDYTRRILDAGYRASYTVPLYFNDNFTGFIFFDSRTPDGFAEADLDSIDTFAHLIGTVVMTDLNAVQAMLGALKTAAQMIHFRDPETGKHLQRMSHFARLIARELARSGKYPLEDEWIERMQVFAPLHDVGKIAIPDRILLKPSRLDPVEQETMRTHAVKGRQIIDTIIKAFDFESFSHINILRHIAEYHHECMDGSGYPWGLKNQEIPVEARIISVADIFDALTHERPYKAAWEMDEAFSHLLKLADSKLDRDCVEALVTHREEVSRIQSRFAE